MSSYSLRWTSNAVSQLKEVADYLEDFSEKTADRILDEIIDFADTFVEMPLRFPECSDLPTKGKIYRGALYEKYRIIYKVWKKEIIILGIIHTSRSPQEIKKLRRLK